MAGNLIIQAARFGDLVQTKRLVLSLLQRGEVHLAVDTSMVALARLLYPQAQVTGLHFHGLPSASKMAENRKAAARLQDARPHAVYNCNFSVQTAALCRLFAAEDVHGYRPVHGPQGGILRSAWARLAFDLSRRRAMTPLNLVDFWAYFVPQPVPAATVNPHARPGGGGLGVVLAGRESRRSLPLPLLASLLESLCGIFERPRLLLLGTAQEQAAARKLCRFLPAKLQVLVEDICGKTDWKSLIQAVQGLDALITPDTGTMHLAAHLGVPVLAFFLSSAWCHETGPYGRGHLVWQTAMSCGPCLETAPCGHDVACLKMLQDTRVLRSLYAMLCPEKQLVPGLPQGLQIWRSDVDGLGGLFRLAYGQDDHAAARAYLRGMIAQRVHAETASAMPCAAAAGQGTGAEAQAAALFQDFLGSDPGWMLPPRRYC